MRRSWSVSPASSSASARLPQPLEHPAGQRRVEERLAAADAAHAVDEVGAADLLQDVAGGAGHDGAEQGLVVGERREHQAGDLGVLRADLAADLDAVAVGQADVEDGDVRARGRDAPVRLLGGAGLADDLEVVLGLEQVAQAAADDLVVVEEEHADRHCRQSRLVAGQGSAGPRSGAVMSEVAGPRSLRELLDAVLALGSDLDPPTHAAADRRGGGRAGRRPLRRARRARRHRHPPGAVHHRRDRRRTPTSASASCPRATASSGLLIVDAKPLRLPDLQRASRQLRVPAPPPADAVVPGGADPGAGARSSATCT